MSVYMKSVYFSTSTRVNGLKDEPTTVTNRPTSLLAGIKQVMEMCFCLAGIGFTAIILENYD